MWGRGIKKGLKSEIPADLQRWNITTAGGQVVALMVSGTESHLMLSLQVVVVSKGCGNRAEINCSFSGEYSL